MSASSISLALVGTYPPTECGIATFTKSLRDSMTAWTRESHAQEFGYVVTGVIRVVDEPSGDLGDEVVAEWVKDDPASARDAAETASRHDCVVLQHEFGIYGGDDGCHVLEFLGACTVPAVAVMHTVVPVPTPHQRDTVEQIADVAAAVVVQTEAARRLLVDSHDIAEERIAVIPHGAASNLAGPVHSLAGDGTPTVLTWGLFGPGKGIEHGIRALAEVDGSVPTYVVAGSTHPKVLAREGEAYRDSLQALTRELGVERHVVFDPSYRDWASLRQMIRSADVVLLPYDSRDQVTSGVLVEALASAKPVVSTAFPHAVEALSAGAGVVVPHEDPVSIADALGLIMGDPALRRRMSSAARAAAEPLLWPQVGQAYLGEVRKVVSALVGA